MDVCWSLSKPGYLQNFSVPSQKHLQKHGDRFLFFFKRAAVSRNTACVRLVVRLHNCFTKLCSSESETCKKIHLCETASTESIVLGQVQSLCILLGFALAPWHRVAWSGFQACPLYSFARETVWFPSMFQQKHQGVGLALPLSQWRARSQRARVDGERARSALVWVSKRARSALVWMESALAARSCESSTMDWKFPVGFHLLSMVCSFCCQ